VVLVRAAIVVPVQLVARITVVQDLQEARIIVVPVQPVLRVAIVVPVRQVPRTTVVQDLQEVRTTVVPVQQLLRVGFGLSS
jgi:type IV secretory pathway VirB3-like protein